jgi:flagellin-specific chaperone FliS
MSRQLELNRFESELLADLLILLDYQQAKELGVKMRGLYGIASEEKQLSAMNTTRADFVRTFANGLLSG